MNTTLPNNYRKGSIIIISLILLLVMTTMAAGLFFKTKRVAQQVNISGNQAESLYTSETCVTEAVQWIETESAKGPPCKAKGAGNLCERITSKNMNHWALTGERIKQKNRMNTHRYRCDISLLGTVASDADAGTGFDVGQSDAYVGGSTSTKYLYKIESRGDSNDFVASTIEVIVSTIF